MGRSDFDKLELAPQRPEAAKDKNEKWPSLL